MASVKESQSLNKEAKPISFLTSSTALPNFLAKFVLSVVGTFSMASLVGIKSSLRVNASIK